MSFWGRIFGAGGYRDGQQVTCQAHGCGKQLTVKFVDKNKIVFLSNQDVQARIALQCQECRAVVCFACSSKSGEPTGQCPLCGEVSGPYPFTR